MTGSCDLKSVLVGTRPWWGTTIVSSTRGPAGHPESLVASKLTVTDALVTSVPSLMGQRFLGPRNFGRRLGASWPCQNNSLSFEGPCLPMVSDLFEFSVCMQLFQNSLLGAAEPQAPLEPHTGSSQQQHREAPRLEGHSAPSLVSWPYLPNPALSLGPLAARVKGTLNCSPQSSWWPQEPWLSVASWSSITRGALFRA